MSMKDDDQTITELARMLADANRARRLPEADRERDALCARLATVEREGLVQIEDLTKIIVERNEELTEVRTRLAQVERERDKAWGQLAAAHADAALSKDKDYLQALNDANADLHDRLGAVERENTKLRGLLWDVSQAWRKEHPIRGAANCALLDRVDRAAQGE